MYAINHEYYVILMSNRLEPELDIYHYPDHLRTSLEQLPRSPGVYRVSRPELLSTAVH